MQDYVGKQFDRYRITERLGMGGMAVVYKAYDTRLQRDVAIKLIRTGEIPESQHEHLMKRFEREALSQARFAHPNIISIYDYGEVNGVPYLAMSYITGGTLKERIKSPVNYKDAIKWLLPIADALQYAHKRKTIHRDVKPSNILFDEMDRPILTDFGIAKILETDDATLTGTGLGVGTPEYMAPEQWVGNPCETSDQYALGVVLYELITGQKPYTADTPVAVALMQANEPLKPPSKIVSGLPEALEKVLYKALAKNPADRYADMGAFQKALEGLLKEEPKQAFEPVKVLNALPQKPQTMEVDSEGVTQDVLEPRPAEEKPTSHAVKKKNQEKQQKIKSPIWLMWVGVSLAGLIFISGVLALALGGRNIPSKDESTSVVAELLTETLVIDSQSTEIVPKRTITPTFKMMDSQTISFTNTPSGPFEYEVQEGDNCYVIAVEFEVDMEVLLALNNLDGNCLINPGDIILIPSTDQELPTTTPLPKDLAAGTLIQYTVRAGDSLPALAEQFYSTVERILEETNKYRQANDEDTIEDQNDILVGDILIIPYYIAAPVPTVTQTPIIVGVVTRDLWAYSGCYDSTNQLALIPEGGEVTVIGLPNRVFDDLDRECVFVEYQAEAHTITGYILIADLEIP